MTVSITIEDIPDETRTVLSAQAAWKGLSLEDYLLEWLITMADTPDVGAAEESR